MNCLRKPFLLLMLLVVRPLPLPASNPAEVMCHASNNKLKLHELSDPQLIKLFSGMSSSIDAGCTNAEIAKRSQFSELSAYKNLLKSEDIYIRILVAKTLPKFKDYSALTQLLADYRKQDGSSRCSIMYSLPQYLADPGSKQRVLSFYERVVEARNLDLQPCVFHALASSYAWGKIRNKPAIRDLIYKMHDGEVNPRIKDEVDRFIAANPRT